MATIRRDIIALGKDKKRGTSTGSLAPTKSSTASPRNTPNYLRSTLISTTTDNNVSKQLGKKTAPATTLVPQRPTLITRSKSTVAKGTLPTTPKTIRPVSSTIPSLRSSSSFSGRTIVASPKAAILGTKKPVIANKDSPGKVKSFRASPLASTVKKSSPSSIKKKQESGKSTNTSATKEQVVGSPVENLNVPEPEKKLEHQGSPVAAAEDQQKVEVVSQNEKGTDDPVPEDQEPLSIEDKDAKIVSTESSTVLEHQNAPLTIKTQESSEEKSCVEETSSKQQESEEHSVNEINSIHNDQSVAGNPNEEAEEKEVEVEETTLNKKEEAASESDNESKEPEEKIVVEEKKQESQNAALRQHGKIDSPTSNHVIEETASKLRDQRKNKVRALAGAFETVISLQ